MRQLYDRIGDGYDGTRQADPFLRNRLAGLLGLGSQERCLDVACGTGNYTHALARSGVRIIGLDISPRMIAAARKKQRAAALEGFVLGTALALPFADGSFAAACCTLAIHHFPDRAAAFREIARILDPDVGRFVLFTSTAGQTERYWLRRYFPEMIRRSAEQMPDYEALMASLHAAGFRDIATEPYAVRPDLEDHFLYCGKERPELYLSPAIRSGISSFANLAAPGEVEHGLARLARDIESGAIKGIIAGSRHDDGDYMFITARR